MITVKELDKIMDYYCNKYNINTKLEIKEDYANPTFYHNKDYIMLSFDYIESMLDNSRTNERHKFTTLRELIIIVLLHELKHSIDYHENKKLYHEKTELKFKIIDKNPIILITGIGYNKLPVEKEADEFANTEIDKWR